MKFRIGGIEECMAVSIFLSVGYLLLAAEFGLPLIENDTSSVFATFFLLNPLIFILLCFIEIFIFERDLDWDGKEVECVKGQKSEQESEE